MLFSKAARLFTLLTTTGAAASATVGMIIFERNNKSSIKEERKVLVSMEEEVPEFQNQKYFYSEDGDGKDKTAQITEEQFKEMQKKASQKENHSGQPNGGDVANEEEVVIESDGDTTAVALTPDATQSDKEIKIKVPEGDLSLRLPEEQEVGIPALPTGGAMESEVDSPDPTTKGDKEMTSNLPSEENKANLESDQKTQVSGDQEDIEEVQEAGTQALESVEGKSEDGELDNESFTDQVGETANTPKSERDSGDSEGVLKDGGSDSELDRKQQIETLEGLSTQINDVLSQLGLKFNL